MSDYKLFWGDSHANLHLGHPKWKFPIFDYDDSSADPAERSLAELEAALAHARTVMDFWPMAYYPYTYEKVNGFPLEVWRADEVLEAHWRAVCELAARHNRPGEFVIFPGFEWQGDARHGDHNVFFFDDGPPLLRCQTLPELYAAIRRQGLKACAIPHHTAYLPGNRSKDWSVHDEEISPFAEIFSAHGCSESDEEWIGLRRNQHMGPGVSGSTIEDALDRGVKTGIIASNDSHANIAGVYGLGLMACYAKELTRPSLWEAFGARRVYGVTGDRIQLDFSLEGAPMGSAVRKAGAARAVVRVRGCDALDRIELLRNNRVIATHCHNGAWEAPAAGGRIRCKLRVEAGWGPKPDDVPDLPPRQWQCSLELSDGAVRTAQPCWKTPGQWVGELGGRRCEFGFRTRHDPPHAFPPAEATVFELEARPTDTVTLHANDQKVEMTLTDAMSRSRLINFFDESADFIRERFGVDTDSLTRKDRTYFYAHKVKVHRAVPEAGFAAELDHLDADPPAGENFYRVRVHQRNGQLAWSSPIWVRSR